MQGGLMGVNRGIIKLLMRMGSGCFGGKLLTVGKQDIYATKENLIAYAKDMNFELKDVEMQVSCKPFFNRKNFLTDTSFFSSLGFKQVDSIDYSSFENCTIVHDLNTNISDELHSKYDVIFDSGTCEHVFNLPKVLENYSKLLKVGGKLILVIPSSNHVDHGLYMFSPTLFHDYFSANKWKIESELLVKYSLAHDNEDSLWFDAVPWEVYEYQPGFSSKNNIELFGIDGMYLIFDVFTKTSSSTSDAPVQQGFYVSKWTNDTADQNQVRDNYIRSIFKNIPPSIRKYLWPLYKNLFPSKIPLNLVAKY